MINTEAVNNTVYKILSKENNDAQIAVKSTGSIKAYSFHPWAFPFFKISDKFNYIKQNVNF